MADELARKSPATPGGVVPWANVSESGKAAQPESLDALLDSERRFRSIFESTPLGMYLYRLAPDGRLVLVGANAAADKIVGVDNSQFIGKTIEEAFPPLAQTDIPARYREAAAEGTVWDAEEVPYDDGQIQGTYEVHAFQTSPNEMAVIFVDVTRRKQMEERLRQSEKMEAIGHLAGGIAHDFNNQLAGIMGYADLLRGTVKDPELLEFVEGILKAAERSSRLTGQLLAFARKGQYEVIPLDVHRTLADVVAILEHSIDKRIAIKQSYLAHPSTVMGDPTLLQNAFLNLGINARDAMPEGGELTIATETVTLSRMDCRRYGFDLIQGPYLVISFSDTGVGIDDETQKRIFEPFFTTKKGGKGTGLGLAAVYGTAQAHHGAIRVVSEPRQGSTFHVYLPLAPMDEEDTADVGEAALGVRPCRILFVDDEEVVREMVKRMLETSGHEVVCCSDGAEGVAYYRDHWRDIDLVILDMVMPELDGREAFAGMRKINPEVKSFLASGYSLDGGTRAILDAGFLGFLQKPFRKRELQRKVADALRDSH